MRPGVADEDAAGRLCMPALPTWLEQTGVELVDEIVGYHLDQAYRYQAELGDADETLVRRAAKVLARAGKAARQRGDDAAAAGLLSRAGDLDRVGGHVLLPDLAELLLWRGDQAEAVRLLDEALAAARANGDAALEALASVERAQIALVYGEGSISGEGLIQLADGAAAALERAGDASSLAVVLTTGSDRAHGARTPGRDDTAPRARARVRAACGDLRRAHLAHLHLYMMKALGPAPVSECIEFVRVVPDGLQSTMLSGSRASRARRADGGLHRPVRRRRASTTRQRR